MSKSKSLIESNSASWRERIATLASELAATESEHRNSLAAMDQAAAQVAAGVSGATKDLATCRTQAEDLAVEVSAKRTVLAAAQRALHGAEQTEAADADARRQEQTAEAAQRLTTAAAEVERLIAELNAATGHYIQTATEYGDLTGRGRDQFHPESRAKVRLSLQGVLIQSLAFVDFPGRDSRAKKSELLKPAGGFLE